MQPSELARIERTAKNHAAYQAKTAPIRKQQAIARNATIDSNYAVITANTAVWQTVEGVEVLRVHDSNYVAAPVTGKKSSARFEVIDLNDRTEAVCQLTKKEVYGWLTKNYLKGLAQC